MKEETLKKIGEKAQGLSLLREIPEWARLKEIAEEKKREQLAALSRKIMSTQPLDQREVDFNRGFWTGISWILDNPEASNTQLKKALAKAGITGE